MLIIYLSLSSSANQRAARVAQRKWAMIRNLQLPLRRSVHIIQNRIDRLRDKLTASQFVLELIALLCTIRAADLIRLRVYSSRNSSVSIPASSSLIRIWLADGYWESKVGYNEPWSDASCVTGGVYRLHSHTIPNDVTDTCSLTWQLSLAPVIVFYSPSAFRSGSNNDLFAPPRLPL